MESGRCLCGNQRALPALLVSANSCLLFFLPSFLAATLPHGIPTSALDTVFKQKRKGEERRGQKRKGEERTGKERKRKRKRPIFSRFSCLCGRPCLVALRTCCGCAAEGKEKMSSSEDEEVYTVEKILARKKVHGRWKYHLKWLGYEETTWETEDNLIGCQDLLQEFLRQEDAKDGRAKRDKDKDKEKEKDKEKDSESTTPAKPASRTPAKTPAAEAVRRSKRRLNDDDEDNDNGNGNGNGVALPSGPSAPPPAAAASTPANAPEARPSPATRKAVQREVKLFDSHCEFSSDPVEITGARMVDGRLFLGVRFDGEEKAINYYLASLLNVKIPQLVIKFYEMRLKFDTPKPAKAE